MVGILASVAVAHAVLAIALMTGGGCRQTKILAPHTYNNGPQVAEVPAPADTPAGQTAPTEMPSVPGGDAPVAPVPVQPKEVKYNEPVAPVTPPVAPAPTGTKTYKVQKGDTLSKIAYKHGVRTSELAACNNLSGKAMNNIRIGQTLTIPEGGVYNESRKVKTTRKSAVKTTAQKSKKSAAKPAAALPADGIYVVKSGDSLDRIGRRFGVSAKAIAKENNIALSKVLQIGDKLRIPGKAAKQSGAAKPAAGAADTAAETTNTDLLNDLDPNAGLDNTNAPSAAPAADTVPAANAAPAADAAAAPAANIKTDSLEVVSDMTLEEFCKRNATSVDVVRKLNPDIPADGNLKGGTFLSVPSLD